MTKIPGSRQIRSLIKKIEKEKALIAAHRDRLRELTGELDQIVDDADEADSDLARAIDALSRML